MHIFTVLTAMSGLDFALGGLAGLVAGTFLLWLVLSAIGKSHVQKANREAENTINQAQMQAREIVKTAQIDAKAEVIKQREKFEKETTELRRDLRDTERQLNKREANLDRKWESLAAKERNLDNRDRKLSEQEHLLASKNEQLTNTLAEQRAKLRHIAGMNDEQAKEMLLSLLENEVTHEASALIEQVITRAREEADSRSREVILNAIQRYAAAHTCDSTVSTVDIPNDEMKGRVIGREGRNIRAFEKATGVDVIIDDTPGVVVVSAFDPVRREVARISLEKLIQDGRIHPARIEGLVEETQKEVDSRILEYGKQATLEANVNGINNKLLPYLGRLHFRSSYGQNVLRHSIEVAFLSQTMAEELGLDGNLARRCGLLHDIGKAADHEIEGGHPQIGADILRRFKERPEVINVAAGHHGDVTAISPYTPLVAAADAMSASRPGARRESLERYIKRLEALEDIARSFKGTKQAYAIQAGREVRVIVEPEKVNDEQAWKIAHDIAKKVEEELTYPGEVKVTLLRELRCIEYAR